MRYIHHLYVTSLALSNALSLCVWKWNLGAKVASNDSGNVSQRFMFSGATTGQVFFFFFPGFINDLFKGHVPLHQLRRTSFHLAINYIVFYFVVTKLTSTLYLLYSANKTPQGTWAYANKHGARCLLVFFLYLRKIKGENCFHIF